MTKQEKGFIYSCLLLTFISEMLLSPFYPQLFSRFFQVDGVQATSLFISCCRLVVILLTPLWALLAKRWSIRTFVVVGLSGMAVGKVLLPTSASFQQFLTISLALLVFQSSMYVLYPMVVAASKQGAGKISATTRYLFMFHGSVIVSGIAGSYIITQPFPLHVYYLFGLVDLILIVICWFIFSTKGAEFSSERTEMGGKESVWKLGFALYSLLVFLFYTGHHMIRPYFTIFVEYSYDTSKQVMSVLYVMPSLVAIGLQPFLPKESLKARLHMSLLCLTAVTGILLLLQVVVESIGWFTVIRILYGICFFISLAAIDLLFFQTRIGRSSPLSFSLVTSVQNIALLFAPMAAILMVERQGIAGPFILSGMLLFSSALCVALLAVQFNKAEIYHLKKGVEQRDNM
ncbi:MFS transporter [Halalkalibacterium halodurans]|uniref:MFS transporter n=1 Tax=Halalkalibacterium halodurans TaxID=86665 RepID=UPI002AAA28D6|nr:MFS transporter [Halalkalibacterium halodurans]MDY7223153.1 MFS transporter [Halalkalibacterium halodurans]MDY7242374.1 MFS transporter [Halalkalibacterium halodurans]